MAYVEPKGGNKYKLVAYQPNAGEELKRVSKTVEVPPELIKSVRKTEQWLNAQLAEYAKKVESGSYKKQEKITFRDFIPIWKSGFANQKMNGASIFKTMDLIEDRLFPVFANQQLHTITTLQLVTFFADLKRQKDGRPLATNTKLNIYKALKSILDAATAWGVIPKNPIDGVSRPSISKDEKKAMKAKKHSYDWEEAQQVLAALSDLSTSWCLLFTGYMIGGFRRGELLAMEWVDIDHLNNRVWVDKQITFAEDGSKTEGSVKTEESESWVTMPVWWMQELKKYRSIWIEEKWLTKDWQGGDREYIWHGKHGQMYYPNTPSMIWTRFLRKNGLPHLKLHGLRHTAAMLLREAGADLKTIQERLRHAKLETTTQYTHRSVTMDRTAADLLEGLNPAIRAKPMKQKA